jgi:hypothetical protein
MVLRVAYQSITDKDIEFELNLFEYDLVLPGNIWSNEVAF